MRAVARNGGGGCWVVMVVGVVSGDMAGIWGGYLLCPLSSFVVVRRSFNICRHASMYYSGAVWAVSGDEAGVWVVGAYIAGHNRVQNL
jgi:hypothetical protein